MIKKYPAGRICQHPNCGTIINIYNKDNFCSLHCGKMTPREYQDYMRAMVSKGFINGKPIQSPAVVYGTTLR